MNVRMFTHKDRLFIYTEDKMITYDPRTDTIDTYKPLPIKGWAKHYHEIPEETVRTILKTIAEVSDEL